MKRISALALCLLLLGGCWDKHEIEDSTFVVLLGLDSAEEGGLTVTVAFPMTQQQGGSVVEGMDNGSGSYAILTAQGATLAQAMSLFSTQLAGPLALHTIKTVVISRHLAQSDMLGQVLAAWRYEDIRNTANIVVSAGRAQDYISARIADSLIDPLRQEELLLEQANGSAYYSPMKLLQLLVRMQSDGGDGVAIYGGVAPEKEEGEQAAQAAALQPGYLPQEVPITAQNRSRISGLAVFRGGRMVGVLDSEEAQTYSLLTGGGGAVVLTVSDPLSPQDSLTVRLIPQGRADIKGTPEGAMPAFTLAARITCTVVGLNSGQDYTQPGNLALLETHMADICHRRMEALIEKLQKEYQADILRLGDTLAHHFATAAQWADYGWAGRYHDAKIGLTVEVSIEHMGVMLP